LQNLLELQFLLLNELYEKHCKRVYNLALQYVQNSEDAEEITQDVFIAIHHSLSSFQEKSELTTWIYRITINKSLDFIKAKTRKKRFALFTSLFSPKTGEESFTKYNFSHPGVLLEQKESLENLFKHINNLKPNQKTALILSKIEQKTQKEIGKIMNLSPKAVESLIQRAKESLSKKLNQNEGNQK
jgi:RNA polymerase sigma factor (sigma-70 family)